MAGGMSPHYVQRFLDHANLTGHAQRAERVREGARGEDTQPDTQSADAETTAGTNDAQKLR
jgi:hypothetical protein